jgi:GT2 family glycosyltransferase
LRLNELASESILYIYADGNKQNASEIELDAIAATRKVIKEQLWCKDVVIIELQENMGLANSVISGVTDVIEKYKKVIVLEDDIIVNTGFLRYMNKSLHLYEKEGRVFGVSGYKFESNRIIKDKTYFLPVMSSWGYGTWSDRWEKIDFDSKSLLQKVLDRDLMGKMKFGKFNFYDMLQQQTNGTVDSWAVRFYTSMIIQNGLFLFPKESLLTNIGFDGSGVHCDKASSPLFETITALDIEKIEVKVEKRILNLFKVSKNKKQSTLKGFSKKIKRVIAPELLNYIRRKRGVKEIYPFEDLRNMPRFVQTKCKLDNVQIVIPDAASFLFMHKEIFEQEIYKFISPTDEPLIIDAGANIGLSTIYFKKLYPKARILAFEPDDYIFKYLKKDNLRFGRGNNVGLRYILHLNYEGVFLLNQDAYLESNTIEECITAHQLNPEAAIISPVQFQKDMVNLDSRFLYHIHQAGLQQPQLFEKPFQKVSFVNAAAWFLPLSTLQFIGGFDPLFEHYGEDDNYCHRVLYHHKDIIIATKSHFIHDRENTILSDPETYSPAWWKLKERQFKVTHANPSNDKTPNLAYSKTIVKKLLKGKFKSILQIIELRRKQREWLKDCQLSKQKTRKGGMHYL